MFNRLSALVLFAQDFEKTAAFYRDTLGLEVVFTDSGSVAFKLQDQDFALLTMKAAADLLDVDEASLTASGRGDRAVLCTQVEDVDATYAALKAKGVEFARPPIDQPWGIRAIYFRDPEGNAWEFFQRPATTA